MADELPGVGERFLDLARNDGLGVLLARRSPKTIVIPSLPRNLFPPEETTIERQDIPERTTT
jgi:hypothetical protein